MKIFLKVIKIIIITLCILLSLSFIITMSCNIVNFGNVIGLIGCLIVIISIILYSKFKSHKTPAAVFKVILSLAGVFAVYCAIISSFIISGMMNTPEKAFAASTDGTLQRETVIVLGCKANNGHPSLMLKARLDKAVEYLLENPQAVCIVTGGQGTDEIEPEAVSMHRYLITKGIDENIIYKEANSKNTEENILYAKKVIDEHDLSENVVIISEGYHVYRGTYNAEKLGLTAAALPTLSTDTLWALPSYWLREIFAITRDYINNLIRLSINPEMFFFAK